MGRKDSSGRSEVHACLLEGLLLKKTISFVPCENDPFSPCKIISSQQLLTSRSAETVLTNNFWLTATLKLFPLRSFGLPQRVKYLP